MNNIIGKLSTFDLIIIITETGSDSHQSVPMKQLSTENEWKNILYIANDLMKYS